jgi:hypothetical protein
MADVWPKTGYFENLTELLSVSGLETIMNRFNGQKFKYVGSDGSGHSSVTNR